MGFNSKPLYIFHAQLRIDCMHVANISSNKTYNYYLKTNDGTRVPVTSVTEENDLGICFDNTLEFDKHINSKFNIWSDSQSFLISGQTYFPSSI